MHIFWPLLLLEASHLVSNRIGVYPVGCGGSTVFPTVVLFAFRQHKKSCKALNAAREEGPVKAKWSSGVRRRRRREGEEEGREDAGGWGRRRRGGGLGRR